MGKLKKKLEDLSICLWCDGLNVESTNELNIKYLHAKENRRSINIVWKFKYPNYWIKFNEVGNKVRNKLLASHI